MSDPILDALWKKVLDHWEDDAAHGAFIEHCQNQDCLLEAAVRYRGMSGDHARGAVAEKRLKSIAALAMAGLESVRSEPARDYGRVVGVLLILFFLAGSVWLVFAMRK